MTFIPVICFRLMPENEAERYLLAVSGYGLRDEVQGRYISMAGLREMEFHFNPKEQPGYPEVRTKWMAHQYICQHWDELKSGDVVDIEYISGEAQEPKIAQRLEPPMPC